MAEREEDASVLSRRRFLGRMSLGLSLLAGAVLSVPILAYLLSPLIRAAPQTWVPVGPVTGFTVGNTVEATYQDPSPLAWAGQTASAAVWVRRNTEQDFTVFAVNCTHLGCPVNWRPDAKLFLCPCHGGVYYPDGQVAGGPPPHPLTRYDARINGANLEILTRPLPV